MSFHFERLIVKDWLAYEGRVEVEFGPPEQEKNIWVVYGTNGAGKTSLLRAIQWVFHDTMPDRHVKDCFNHNALRAGRGELSVQADFLYNGRRYRLTRRAQADVQDGKVQGYPRPSVDLAIDNEPQNPAGIFDTIQQILPQECQRFFFFDGLEIKEYASPHSEDTRDAIERVLGIPEVRNLEHDLGRLSDELGQERDRLVGHRAEYDEAQDKKTVAEFQLESARETLQQLREKRNNLEQLVSDLQQRANRLEQVKDEQDLLKGYRRQKQNLQDRLDNYDDELRKLVTIVTRRMTLPMLRQREVSLETEVGRVERVTQRLTNVQARREIIQELLEQDRCLCDRELTPPVVSHLESLLDSLDQDARRFEQMQQKSGTVRSQSTLKGRLESIIQTIEAEPSGDQIEGALLTKYNLDVELEELEQEIRRLESKLAGHEDVEVSEVYRLLGERRVELNQIRDEHIPRAEAAVEEAEREVKTWDQKLNEIAQTLPQQNRLIATLKRTQAAQAVARELVSRIVDLRHDSVERHLTNIFRSVTNKPDEYDRIELGQDYTPRVVTKAGNVVQNDELSAGEKEVVAFSFIAGLNLSTETSAPLIMDTPFGHLDIQHRNGLLEALPKLPCQVVLLATDRDLPGDELPKLTYCLGGVMQIQRDQLEERSYVEELE